MSVKLNDSQKLILKIVLLFFILYFFLLIIYNFILSAHTPDFFTVLTSKQVTFLYNLTGFNAHYEILSNPAEIGIFSGHDWLVKIIEGCNGISVIIVFLAFIWAFPAELSRKIWYSIIGMILIWGINLLRIYVLGLIYRFYPQWFDVSHRVFFPASIYGIVILLWILWIRKIVKL